MATIIRNRTIRTKSRGSESSPYKVDTKKVTASDVLIVNIDHKSMDFFESYTFNGKKVAQKNSISFTAIHHGNRIDITWSSAQPDGLPSRERPVKNLLGTFKNAKSKKTGLFSQNQTSGKAVKPSEDFEVSGFDPVVNKDSRILILGTMPGAESLEKQQYYAYSRNLFWEIMGKVFSSEVPEDYEKRKKMLLDQGIAIWDVCKTFYRKGSLDANIEDAEPNDLEGLIEEYPIIKTIAFNGKEAAKLFGKHFGSIKGIKLLVLPSTSPANAAISYEDKLKQWGNINSFLDD